MCVSASGGVSGVCARRVCEERGVRVADLRVTGSVTLSVSVCVCGWAPSGVTWGGVWKPVVCDVMWEGVEMWGCAGRGGGVCRGGGVEFGL